MRRSLVVASVMVAASVALGACNTPEKPAVTPNTAPSPAASPASSPTPAPSASPSASPTVTDKKAEAMKPGASPEVKKADGNTNKDAKAAPATSPKTN
ncbi:MAG: hypothetical protein ACT4O9_00260 [Blastocatellia bacterium]